jgi:hypothetical protein
VAARPRAAEPAAASEALRAAGWRAAAATAAAAVVPRESLVLDAWAQEVAARIPAVAARLGSERASPPAQRQSAARIAARPSRIATRLPAWRKAKPRKFARAASKAGRCSPGCSRTRPPCRSPPDAVHPRCAEFSQGCPAESAIPPARLRLVLPAYPSREPPPFGRNLIIGTGRRNCQRRREWVLRRGYPDPLLTLSRRLLEQLSLRFESRR